MERLISKLLEERGLTLSELTAQLGYQSKTSLVRIIKDQASKRALDAFVRRLEENICLTDAEREMLEQVLEYMRWRDDYPASQEMLSFLRGDKAEESEVWLDETGTGARAAFSSRYARARDIRITLLNCQFVPIFSHLLALVRSQGALVEHFLQRHEESVCVIHGINALIPLIYERGYAGYAYRADAGDRLQKVRGLLSADVMVVQYADVEGVRREEMIVFDSADHGFVQTGVAAGSFAALLGIDRECFEPIKRTYYEIEGFERYVQFSRDCAELEYNRAIYKIKPDIGIDWIPEDILVQALLEGGIPGIEEMCDIVDELESIYRKRVANTYEKRRVVRTIMKRSAMLRFARTGRMSDHFWGLRPFTCEERLRILRLVLEQVKSNPYSYVYFLKDNDFLRDAEIGYYENVGILVLDSSTDYELSESHSEALIVHEEFMRLFKEFFERSLIVEHVVSQTETVDFLNELIRIVMSLT